MIDHENEFARLWHALVPVIGHAETVQGEMIRAAGRLMYECINNGNVNWAQLDGHAYYEQLVDYLDEWLAPKSPDMFTAIDRVMNYGVVDAEATLILRNFVVEWCLDHPAPIPHNRADTEPA